MDRELFMTTNRMGFSNWRADDIDLADSLWGDARVTRYICATGRFTAQDVAERLSVEVANGRRFHVQYWPVFQLAGSDLIGCCGLRPHADADYELGVHLRPAFWGSGYATEGARAVIDYAFGALAANKLFAGHHPDNDASRRLLSKLGFTYVGDEYYAPTGLMHPSYELLSPRPPA